MGHRSTGIVGSVSINGDNTIKYNPTGVFNSLKPGETAQDTFKYQSADSSNAASNEVTVTVTINGT